MLKKSIFILFFSLCLICIGYFLCSSNILQNNTDSQQVETVVNGVNLNTLTQQEAVDFFDEYIDEQTSQITLDIEYNDKVWCYNGSNFEATSNIHTILEDLYSYNKNNNYIKKVKMLRQIQKMGFDNYIALNYSFRGIDEKIDGIISEIEQPAISSEITFNAKTSTFNITPSQIGIKVNRDKLASDIVNGLQKSKQVVVKVETEEILPEYTEEMLKKCTKKQAAFSTSYAHSSVARKNNINLAVKQLNGTRINACQIFSFNDIIGVRSEEKGYQTAKIIKNGEFVAGVGGGICQVSTTLYNALLLANIDILEVHKHSLPVSYVKPSLDAMVSWGSADLKFKNNTQLPIFISAKCDGENIIFEIYGDTKPEGITIKTRSEIVDTIPFGKDKIIKDTEQLYLDKIMFKGEFLRVKNGKEGYESKAYLQYYKNGKMINEKQIRFDRYEPQCGVVYEGVEDLIEGFTLPNQQEVS